MRSHIVVKLHRALEGDGPIPHWLPFISDKSIAREHSNLEVDTEMASFGRRFWLTQEYMAAAAEPTPDERAEGLNRTYRLILKDHAELPTDLIERLNAKGSVESARPILVEDARLPQYVAASSTSAFSDSKSTPARTRELIGLPYARAMTLGSPDIRVAVLDTGADLEHPELKQKFKKRADFVNLEGLDTTGFIGDFSGYDEVPEDEVGHGTHVSGIVAARGLQMEQGVAPECSLMAVRVLATMKSGDRRMGAGIVDNINAGIKWAVDQGAHVINMSLGIKHTGGGLPHEDVIRYALRKNVSVVAASGNDGTAERYYPGALRGVFAVGAIDDAGKVAGFSSYGANIFVVAPGMRVLSSFARGGYALASGTSQAAPFVSGAVALFKSYAHEQGMKLSNQDVADILKATSDKVDSRLRHTQAGYGIINLADAFKLLSQQLI